MGRVADKAPPKIMGPAVLIFQIIQCGAYYFVEDPRSWFAYVLAAFLTGTGAAVIVVLQGYAVKRVPKAIRGITMAFIIAISAAGAILYLQISKIYFQTAPWMIFVLISICDVVTLLLLVPAIIFGYWGDTPKNMIIEDDGGSQDN